MKTMIFKTGILAAIVFACMTFTSCQKDSNLDPQIGLKFITVTASFPVSSDLKSTQEPKELEFTSGFITLSEVSFEVETDEDLVEIEFEIEQNTVIDFATGGTDPDISYVEIPAGTYNEMEVEVELQDEGDNPSMVLHGTYVDTEGASHPVRFEFNSGETFEVEKEGTITLATNESVLAQITFDPTVWFAGVSNEQMSQATKDNEGVIVISSTQNPDIFDTVTDGLDLATEVEIVIN